ncbi:MAG: glycoside hydrolase family 13 protein, partial [Clostridia bacterium]|nr:glycoside hydrolase family 13 protein [Clostridia bacterium]
TCGAYNSPDSPYASWFRFRHFPDDYACWWDVWSLPEVEESDPSYLTYITGENGILAKWLQEGLSGWRLDVADELPDIFLDTLRKRVKSVSPDALIIGEVWEDASNKISYNALRKFLLGSQLDTVMNYPLRKLILELLDGTTSAEQFVTELSILASNYPKQAFFACMNFLSTHDVCRVTTKFGKAYDVSELAREEQALVRLSDTERKHAAVLHKSAALLLYSLPGMPCIYYGDENGLEGGTDPFNRAPFPWGAEDSIGIDLTEWYRCLGNMRRDYSVLRHGAMRIWSENGLLLVRREENNGISTLTVINPTNQTLPLPKFCGTPLFGTSSTEERTIEEHGGKFFLL